MDESKTTEMEVAKTSLSKNVSTNSIEVGEYLQEKPISEIPNVHRDIAKDLILMAEYYGIKQPSTEMAQMMSLDILDTYPHLRQKDVVRAFKLAARGKIKISLELYGKPMNGWLVNQIIQAFIQYMNKLRREHKEKLKREELLNAKRNVGQCPEEISKANDERLKAIDELTKKMKIK